MIVCLFACINFFDYYYYLLKLISFGILPISPILRMANQLLLYMFSQLSSTANQPLLFILVEIIVNIKAITSIDTPKIINIFFHPSAPLPSP